MQSANAERASTAKSRSLTPSSELPRDAVEAEFGGRGFAVQRIAGAGKRARTERADVRAAAAIGEPAAVPFQHLHVGEQVVGEEHGLCRLDVRHAGQDRVALAIGETHQSPLHLHDRAIKAVQRSAQPQADIRGDLVVAGAAGVDLAGDRPDPLAEGNLQVHVDVLEARVPDERAGLHVGLEALQPLDQHRDFIGLEQSGPAQPVDVRDRAVDIVDGEHVVEIDRTGELGHPLVGSAFESTAPHLHGRMLPGRTRANSPAAPAGERPIRRAPRRSAAAPPIR